MGHCAPCEAVQGWAGQAVLLLGLLQGTRLLMLWAALWSLPQQSLLQ
jgi:hypothetical protein